MNSITLRDWDGKKMYGCEIKNQQLTNESIPAVYADGFSAPIVRAPCRIIVASLEIHIYDSDLFYTDETKKFLHETLPSMGYQLNHKISSQENNDIIEIKKIA